MAKIRPVGGTSNKKVVEFSETFRRDFERLLHWRRDVRRFETTPVEQSLLQHLVELTLSAPSVGFSQPTRLVDVRGPERRQAVVAEYERCNAEALAGYSGAEAHLYASLKLAGLKEAPVQLAVFADESTTRGKGLGRRQMPESLAYSAVTSVHTLWLAARAYGLGLGWVSILDPAEVSRILQVPGDWRFIAYLCLGYPIEEHEDRELVRAGWESADPVAGCLVVR